MFWLKTAVIFTPKKWRKRLGSEVQQHESWRWGPWPARPRRQCWRHREESECPCLLTFTEETQPQRMTIQRYCDRGSNHACRGAQKKESLSLSLRGRMGTFQIKCDIWIGFCSINKSSWTTAAKDKGFAGEGNNVCKVVEWKCIWRTPGNVKVKDCSLWSWGHCQDHSRELEHDLTADGRTKRGAAMNFRKMWWREPKSQHNKPGRTTERWGWRNRSPEAGGDLRSEQLPDTEDQDNTNWEIPRSQLKWILTSLWL